ncbi:MAG: ATP-binding protein [Candidatus Woesearchaeota archaeon]
MKKIDKSIEQKFKKLTDLEHVLLRPGMYIGSTQPHTSNTWIFNEETKKMEKREVTWNPGLQKLFDEIISNSVDESKRKESHLDIIKVEIDKQTGKISVYDNGGIPVEIHKEHNMYVPTMVFAELKAGSNFDDSDDRTWVGTNGVGASLVNIFSKEFRVETCDGKKYFRQDFSENNHKRKEPKIRDCDKPHTKITFLPDYERLGCTLDDGNYSKILKRVVDVAACNPNLKVYLNGERIQLKSFKDYIEMYAEEYEFEELPSGWKIGIAHSEDGFQHVSFVNGSETIVGGSHVDFISSDIAEKLRVIFNKKHKVDVKPSELKQHIILFIDATIVNPKYDSQTKEKLINELPKNLRDKCEVSEKLIKKLSQSHIIQSVLDWINAKAQAQQMAELRKLNREADKTDPRRVEKFSDALEKRDRHKCILMLCEGDSAAKAIQSGRGKNPYIASFPLKGKPLNVRDVDPKKILENEEIKKILTITGLKLGEKVTSIAQLRFGKISACTDADLDGSHIRGLLQNLFYTFWPELFEMEVISFFKTPLIKIWIEGKKKEEKWFYNENEYQEWLNKHPNVKHKMKWYKGLGTSTAKEFGEYLEKIDDHLVTLKIIDSSDGDSIDLAFNKQRADDRKKWLNIA